MEQEYRINTEIGKTVYRVEINIRKKGHKPIIESAYKDGIFVTELKIVHQTATHIALSDNCITRLDRQLIGEKKDNYKSYLNEPFVQIRTNDTCFANGIFASMYTIYEPKSQIKTLQKEIQSKISSTYGFLTEMNIPSIIKNMKIQIVK